MEFALTGLDLGQCKIFAASLASVVKAPTFLELIGTLGAGKTQWTRFFVEAMVGDSAEVASPTFVLVKEYAARCTIYHLDLYRLNDEDELLEIGFEEMIDQDAIVIVEWGDKFPDAMPRVRVQIQFSVCDSDSELRDVCVIGLGAETGDLVSRWHQDVSQRLSQSP